MRHLTLKFSNSTHFRKNASLPGEIDDVDLNDFLARSIKGMDATCRRRSGGRSRIGQNKARTAAVSDSRLKGKLIDRIKVRLDPQRKEQLDSTARAEGVSPSEVVRAALREHFKGKMRGASYLDIARRMGVVGIDADAPTDLSTNPAYMEGFGAD